MGPPCKTWCRCSSFLARGKLRNMLAIIWVGVSAFLFHMGEPLLIDSPGPQFVIEPPYLVEYSNSTGVTIDCIGRGQTTVKVEWHYADGLPVNYIPGLRHVLNNGSLSFPPFSANHFRPDIHSSVLRCVLSNQEGKLISRDVHIRAVVDQTFEVTVPDVAAAFGQSALLRCMVPLFIKAYVTITSWIKNSAQIIYPTSDFESKRLMLTTGDLLIRTVEASDNYANYQCRVLHRLSGKTTLSSNMGKLTLSESKSPLSARVMDRFITIHANQGDNVILFCPAQGYPPPYYSWYKDSSYGLEMVQANVRGELYFINQIQEHQSGRYYCYANNSLGGDRSEIQVVVSSPLMVSVTPTYLKVNQGQEAALTCASSGGMFGSGFHGRSGQLSWLKDGHPMRLSPRHSVLSDKLVIRQMQKEDQGMYQCMVKADRDMAQSASELRLGDVIPVFLYRFIDQTVQPGMAVSLKCSATGSPSPSILWNLDGFPILHNDRFLIGQYVNIHGEVISHVNITTVYVEDGGLFSCTAANRIGSVTHSALLNVYGLPVVRHMGSLTAVAGETLVVKCPAAGYPLHKITWEREGKLLPLSRRQEVTVNGTLIINNLQQLTDRGNYSCTATNKQAHSDSKALQVNIMVPPKIVPFQSVEGVALGSRITLTCVVSEGDTPLTITWLKNGHVLQGEEGVEIHVFSQYNAFLTVERVTPAHSGNYSCEASNAAATVAFVAQIQVYVPPKIAPFAFRRDLAQGIRVQATCAVESGDLPLTFAWLKEQEPLDPVMGLEIRQLDAYSSVMIVNELAPYHAGNYTCVVANLVARAQLTAVLIVSVPPEWTQEPRDERVRQGEKFGWPCAASGFPQPTIVWKKVVQGKSGVYSDIATNQFSTDLPIHFSNGTLLFRSISKADESQYLCEAFNGIGVGLSKFVQLTVEVSARINSHSTPVAVKLNNPAHLHCTATGDAPLSLTWRHGSLLIGHSIDDRVVIQEKTTTDGSIHSEMHWKRLSREDSGIYHCFASNLYGHDERAVQLLVQEPPDPPKQLRVTDKSSRSVQLAWTASTDGNSPLIHYKLQYKIRTVPWQERLPEVIVSGTENVAMVTGLHPATSYEFKLISVNSMGESLPSEVLEVTTDNQEPSGPPLNVRVNAVSSRALEITYNQPILEHLNGQLKGYLVGIRELKMAGDYYYHKTEETVTELVVNQLHPFTRYAVVVKAFNSAGIGPPSDEVIGQTVEDVPEGPPSETRCLAVSSQSLQISWQSPEEMFCNGIIIGYKVLSELAEPQDNSEGDVKTSTTPNLVLSGLHKFTNYSIQIAAFTKAGLGPYSMSVYCRTLEDVPDAPAAIKALSSSSNSVALGWLLPNQVNGQLIKYHLYIRALESSMSAKLGKSKAVTGTGTGTSKDSPLQYRAGQNQTKQQDASTQKLTLSPSTTFYQVGQLQLYQKYQFWVSGVTKVGEGALSHAVTVGPATEIPAGVVSFGRNLRVNWKEDVNLECNFVGKPEPAITWRKGSLEIQVSDKRQVFADGSLILRDLQLSDRGNYSCHVRNKLGADQVTYSLIVLVPPTTPVLSITYVTNHSVSLKWNLGDSGGMPLLGYVIRYRLHGQEWREERASKKDLAFTLAGLKCGSAYQVYMVASNRVGLSEASNTIATYTKGATIKFPVQQNEWIVVNTTSIMILMKGFDRECPLKFMAVEYRPYHSSTPWITAALHEQGGNYVFDHLEPATRYLLKLIAHNDAGTSSVDLDITTLSIYGSTILPNAAQDDGLETSNFFADVRILTSMIISSVTVFITLCVMCFFYWSRRRAISRPNTEIDSGQFTEQAADHRFSYVQRERCYSTVSKRSEYDDEICPYATFQMKHIDKSSSPDNREGNYRMSTYRVPVNKLGEREMPTLRLSDKMSDEEASENSKWSDTDTDYYRESYTNQDSRKRHPPVPKWPIRPGAQSRNSKKIRQNPPSLPPSNSLGWPSKTRRLPNVPQLTVTPERIEPPSKFADFEQHSEAECDLDPRSKSRRLKAEEKFTIAV